MDTKQTFNDEAEVYEQTSRAVNIFFDESLDTLANFLVNVFQPKSNNQNLTNDKQKTVKPLKILDICCGTGILTEKVAKQFPTAKFIGVDFAKNMLEIATKRMKNYNFTPKCFDILDADKMNKLGKFDIIISSFGVHNIHGFDKKQIAINNIISLLKNGGTFITCDILKGHNKKEDKHYKKFQYNWLLKTYNKKQAKEWIKLLAEEDDPETISNNFKLLENANCNNIKLIWQKEFLAIWSCNK